MQLQSCLKFIWQIPSMKKSSIAYFRLSIKSKCLGLMFMVSWMHIMAVDFIRNTDYQFMTTANYSFMDSIADYISDTNLEKVCLLSQNVSYTPCSTSDFVFYLTVYKVDEKTQRYEFPYGEERMQLLPRGSYRLSVRAYYMPCTGEDYVFSVKGYTFFSMCYLEGYFKRKQSVKTYKSFMNYGNGYTWDFIICDGKVTGAYAYHANSEVPREVLDLNTGKIMSYEQYKPIFYHTEQK